MTRRTIWILVFAALSSTACTGAAPRQTGSPNLITREQLVPLESLSAYDAIQRLRPTWLQARGPTSLRGGPTLPEIHINDSRSRTLDDLRSLPVIEVETMEYRNAADATTLYGTGYTGGVIEVRTRR
jgi:hypothetical protein